ncbi:DUF2922 domain-containing protein [Alkalihalobacillus sp. BA299]|uniref:DUF2922 domain-containing protein n=1 Tax=Alkalihalobacillus sp. BA299 TaxID=2815938 RepID=UPI001ADC4635|nr:DUF2922 domain-containing protein [Alkalihalobacillus sp. BA299]
MTKKLELIFENEQAKTVTLSLDTPVYPVDPAAVSAAKDAIIAQNAFTSSGGKQGDGALASFVWLNKRSGSTVPVL